MKKKEKSLQRIRFKYRSRKVTRVVLIFFLSLRHGSCCLCWRVVKRGQCLDVVCVVYIGDVLRDEQLGFLFFFFI